MSRTITASVRTEGFEAILYPGSGRKDKVMIVMSGSNGGMTLTKQESEFYHRNGVPALALALFKTKQTPEDLSRVPVEFVEKAIAWLKKLGYRQIGIDGTSKGSEMALVAASMFPDLSCVIVRVPSHFVSEGLAGSGKNKSPSGTSCWSYQGKELPYAPYRSRTFNILQMFLQEKEMHIITFNRDKEITPETLIPIEKIKAPILMLSSKHDEVWPSYESAVYMENRLTETGFPYPHKHVAYANMSHAVLTKLPWIYKMAFKSERRHPRECAKDREALQKELLDWVNRDWQGTGAIEKRAERPVNVPDIKAVVGTNAWGDALYGTLVRGSYVEETVIRDAVQTSIGEGIPVFDTARDYGLGKGQPIVGRLCREGTLISAKYTPVTRYKPGQVRASLEKDLKDFGRKQIDIYWLHLPNDIRENLSEMIGLCREGKIRQIGVSNFNLEECRLARKILQDAGLELYGVQNHFSLLDRKWEKEGLVGWCRENGISFWAWAVLEEGMLVPPKKNEQKSIMKMMFRRKRRKLYPLYKVMQEIGKAHRLKIPQVAMSYVSSKGMVPVCGCRKPEQVKQLAGAVKVTLSPEEITRLERAAYNTDVKILGADMFRFAVRK